MGTARDTRLRSSPRPPPRVVVVALGVLCLVLAFALAWVGGRARASSGATPLDLRAWWSAPLPSEARPSEERPSPRERGQAPETRHLRGGATARASLVDPDEAPAQAMRDASRLRLEATRVERASAANASVAPRDVALSPVHPEAPRFSNRRSTAASPRRVALGERRGTSLHDRAGARLPPLRAPPA